MRLIATFFILIVVIATIINLPVIFQESNNPLAIGWGILRLFINQEDIVRLSGAPEKYIATNSGESVDIKLSRVLEKDGWQFKDRMGAGIFFTRGTETLFGHIRMLTSWFQVIEIKPNR